MTIFPEKRCYATHKLHWKNGKKGAADLEAMFVDVTLATTAAAAAWDEKWAVVSDERWKAVCWNDKVSSLQFWQLGFFRRYDKRILLEELCPGISHLLHLLISFPASLFHYCGNDVNPNKIHNTSYNPMQSKSTLQWLVDPFSRLLICPYRLDCVV